MVRNLTDETKQRLLAWWRNEEQHSPVILGTVYTRSFPVIPDIEEYWRSNRIRWRIFKERAKSARYYGCAVPHHYLDFGASAMAGALGCRMNPLTFDTIWPSHRFSSLPEPDEIRLQTEGDWYRTLWELAAWSAAEGEVSTGFYALGGVCDTLGSLYGEQNLLLDMIDEPEAVHAALSRICDIWLSEKEKLTELLFRKDGMASWAGIWAPGTTFPVQDDISFMLSPDMYKEFCLPYVRRCIESLDYPIYHLDGPGAVPHLDVLLELPALRVIQWVPGAGHEALEPWLPLIGKILSSGRSAQLYCRADEVDMLVRKLGPRGLLLTITDPTDENMEQLLKKYN